MGIKKVLPIDVIELERYAAAAFVSPETTLASRQQC